MSAEICPICGASLADEVGVRRRRARRRTILDAKRQGMADAQIGARFGISFHHLERIITEACGTNVSLLGRPKRCKALEPQNFQEETATVWSFKQRGNWATHDGRYRGNRSPYIPRNVILKYSRPGDTVLDYFVGGGTTAIEAKLLGRRCIARDINPEAIALTRNNLDFTVSFPGEIDEPEVSVGDARSLPGIPDESVDLICAHPPYAGIINYSIGLEGDLSRLSLPEFLAQMGQVARESYRVLKPGGQCAILIGDARRAKRVVPVGFPVIRVFLDVGFKLHELVIKRQHNCKTTGFWYTRSIQHNFLLLAHEYLPIFEKPASTATGMEQPDEAISFPSSLNLGLVEGIPENRSETTTVWMLPSEALSTQVLRNLLRRFGVSGTKFAKVLPGAGDRDRLSWGSGIATPLSLLYVRSPERLETAEEVFGYRKFINQVAGQAQEVLPQGGTLAIETRDVRLGEIWPMGLLLWEDIHRQGGYANKEIVIIIPETARKGVEEGLPPGDCAPLFARLHSDLKGGPDAPTCCRPDLAGQNDPGSGTTLQRMATSKNEKPQVLERFSGTSDLLRAAPSLHDAQTCPFRHRLLRKDVRRCEQGAGRAGGYQGRVGWRGPECRVAVLPGADGWVAWTPSGVYPLGNALDPGAGRCQLPGPPPEQATTAERYFGQVWLASSCGT